MSGGPGAGGPVPPEAAVKAYIERQAEHHAKEDFKAELMRLLRAHDIEADERYVFD